MVVGRTKSERMNDEFRRGSVSVSEIWPHVNMGCRYLTLNSVGENDTSEGLMSCWAIRCHTDSRRDMMNTFSLLFWRDNTIFQSFASRTGDVMLPSQSKIDGFKESFYFMITLSCWTAGPGIMLTGHFAAVLLSNLMWGMFLAYPSEELQRIK